MRRSRREINDFTPMVAQWEKSTHPAQQKLYGYLDWVRSAIGPLPDKTRDLFLHLEVDVGNAERKQKGFDLENFLTPPFGSRCFNPNHFVLAVAKKKVGGGSSLRIGRAEQVHGFQATGWNYFGWSAESATGWKENLRQEMSNRIPQPTPDGPVDARVAWRCSPHRNWTSLWKPTGDAMGPILGEYPGRRNMSPKDDRIVSLEFHLNAQGTGDAIDIGIWWRLSDERISES